MDFEKLKQKLRVRGSKVNHNRRDQADGQAAREQQRGNEDNTSADMSPMDNSTTGFSKSSISTSAPTGSQPPPLRLWDKSSKQWLSVPEASDTPIHELWNLAYEHLRESDEDLIVKYEAKLRGNFTAGLGSTLGLTPGSRADTRDLMETILQRKMDEINRDTWKLKFGSSEIQVKDLVQPVLGVVNWANEYITAAVSANSSASIAWGGVSLLLPLFLNPPKQAASLAKGLEETSSLIAHSRMWEDLYIRRCESNNRQMKNSSPDQRNGFKYALEQLYQKILRFQIGSYCYYDRNGAFRLGQDIVKWNEWDDLLENIRHQERKFASINDTWKDITYEVERSAAEKRHSEAIRRWQTIGTDVSGLLEVVRDAQEKKQRDGLLDWLCAVDPSEAYNAARDKHMTGTSDWLIRVSQKFKTWETSASSLLWLNGKPGCGKSILSSSVVKHLRDRYASDPQTALAYFFFSFSDPRKQNVNGMLASLVKQIYARRPDTPEPIQALSEYKTRGERPDTETLIAAALAITHGFSATFIVIDALDECPTMAGERAKLLTSLKRIIAVMPDNVHILCTSRAELDIVTTMRTVLIPPSRAEIDLVMYRNMLDHDIGLYIDETLASAAFTSWPSDLKDEAKETLMKNADGMFQYIFCQFENLQNLASVPLIRAELQQLPIGLDATYERLLVNVDPRFQPQIINSLKWIASSNRDLRLEELAEIFVLCPGNDAVFDNTQRLCGPADFIRYMSSLIVVRKVSETVIRKKWIRYTKEVTYIRLAHFTVKEYLMSKRIANGPAKGFSFTETDAHLHIAHSCLAYYLHCVNLLGEGEEDFSDHELRTYAFENWMLHLEMVPLELWSADVGQLAARALAIRSESVRTILEVEDYTIWDLTGLEVDLWLRNEVLTRPHIYTALRGYVNLTDMLLSGGPGTNPYLTQEDIDLALHYAALGGSTAVVQLLISKGADCNSDNGPTGGALHAAAYRGHIAIVELLLDRGANIDAQHGGWGTALQAAASRDHLDVVQLLVGRGSNINASADEAGCAMTLAVPTDSGRGIECLRFLLDNGADVNMQCPTRGAALHHAAAHMISSKNKQCIRLLLERGADVNARGGYYGTPLQALFSNELVEFEHKRDVAKLLLDRGADVNMQGGIYGSALHSACCGNDAMKSMQFLLENGADLSAEGGYHGTMLQAACCSIDQRPAQHLIDLGANVNASGGEFGSALQAAALGCGWDSHRLVMVLLSKGADVNALGGRYGTALQAACADGRIDNVRTLLNHGAEVNAEGGEYGSALQAACQRILAGCEVPRLLIEHGANVHLQGGTFGSAWHAAAAQAYNEDVLQLLLDHNVDVDDARGRRHVTALHAALDSSSFDSSSQESRIHRIGFLLDHGANVNIGGEEDGFPLQSACANAQEHSAKVTKFLLERCPEVHVNAAGGVFGSALQAAAHSGQIDSVRMLLDKGANVNAQGGLYGSALDAAVFRGYWDIVEVLLERGAIPDGQPHEEWFTEVRDALGRGAAERYRKFWERRELWEEAVHVHREDEDHQ